MSLANRLKSRREELGLSQTALARIAGVSQQLISKIETGKSDATTEGPKLARALRVSIDWLLEGVSASARNSLQTEEETVQFDTAGFAFDLDLRAEDDMEMPAEKYFQVPDQLGERPSYYGNTEPGPVTRGFVPVISWVKAGQWNDAEGQTTKMDSDEFLPCPASHGPNTYALRVKGDSMTSPHGRSYPEGCLIYVDPDQRGGIASGDRVIARLDGESAVTFKVYIEDGGRRILKPLNSQYPIITEPFRVLGKVIGMWME